LWSNLNERLPMPIQCDDNVCHHWNWSDAALNALLIRINSLTLTQKSFGFVPNYVKISFKIALMSLQNDLSTLKHFAKLKH